jgi:hypothetical protein
MIDCCWLNTLGLSGGLRLKHLAALTIVITLYDYIRFVWFGDQSSQFQGVLFRREGFPVERRVGPANMVMSL